ncbi:MAG: DNA polymerase III subunit delta [Chloroflexota bacterium]|nr:DNA polymerase III subunit delta [Chloroflexota bacterium]
MLYILYGEDDFSRQQVLDEIKSTIGDETALVTNTTVIDAPQATIGQLRAVAEAMPFLAEKRLLIIHGLLERFESRARSGRRKKAASTSNRQNEYQPLADYLVTVPDSTVVVLVDGKISSKNPLFSALSAKAKVKSFPLLKKEQLIQWVQNRVAGNGGSISPQAVTMLTDYVGSNLWIIASEIDKLILFTGGGQIEADDVRRVVSYVHEASVFNLADAILEFRGGMAEKLAEQLLQKGASPAYLLVMLTRQARLIVRVKELKNQRRAEAEIMGRLEIASPFILRRTLEQASRYTLPRLKEVYHKLLETDLAIKTGRYDAELAINILIAELCQRAAVRAT